MNQQLDGRKHANLVLPARGVVRPVAAVKTRFVVILLLLNAAALAAGFVYFNEYWGRQTAQDGDSAKIELEGWKARAAASPAAPAAPVIAWRTNEFRWSQLESTDYRQYIANLRAVGCPESTLKDIILTDVMRLYARQLGQYYHNGRAFKYWETNDKRKLTQPQIEERDRALSRIDKELPSVLRELLGVNYERELNKYFVDADEDDRRLDFLSEDKRAQTLALRDRFEGARERILYELPNGKPSPGDLEKLRQIDQEQDEALSRVLTSGEKEQYELTTSPTADRLRQQLIGFNPTEEEFRALYRRQKAIDDAYEFEDTNDPTVIAAKAAEQAGMMKEFEAGLTSERATAIGPLAGPRLPVAVRFERAFQSARRHVRHPDGDAAGRRGRETAASLQQRHSAGAAGGGAQGDRGRDGKSRARNVGRAGLRRLLARRRLDQKPRHELIPRFHPSCEYFSAISLRQSGAAGRGERAAQASRNAPLITEAGTPRFVKKRSCGRPCR